MDAEQLVWGLACSWYLASSGLPSPLLPPRTNHVRAADAFNLLTGHENLQGNTKQAFLFPGKYDAVMLLFWEQKNIYSKM